MFVERRDRIESTFVVVESVVAKISGWTNPESP
jgi:hypothetical protein